MTERDTMLQSYLDWALENLLKSKDDDELYDFIEIFFDLKLPRQIIVPGHSSPFQFIADTFFERESDTLCIGNRNGGKTLAYGLKNALDGVFKGCEIASIGAIVPQAEKQYGYTQAFLKKPFINKFLIASIMKHTVVESPNGRSIIQILPGTMNGVNSPHPQKANVDEIELMDWKILQEAMSMPCSNENTRASLCMTSSRKFAYGNMEKLLGEAEARLLKIYKWSIWETIEPCTSERSGLVPCKYSFVPYEKADDIVTINVFTHNDNLEGKEILSDVAKKDPKTYSGCLSCALVQACQLKAKQSKGFYRIDDAIKKFRMMDRETWDSQWESLKPMTEGLVYKQYSDAVHCLKGESQWKYQEGYVTGASLDAGFEHNAVMSFFQEDSVEDIYMFDEEVHNHTTSHELVILYWLPKLKKYGFVNNPRKIVYYDPSAKDEAMQLKAHGIKVEPADNEVDAGIKSVRSYLRNSDGTVRFFINECCLNARREFGIYHYKPGTEIVDKIEDDSMDSVRYYIHSRHPLASVSRKFKAKIIGSST